MTVSDGCLGTAKLRRGRLQTAAEGRWSLHVKSSFPAAQWFYQGDDWLKRCLPGLLGQTTVDFPMFVLSA